MSGRYSRNKGKRGEYQLRDYFRSLGWESNRVPSSGAAQGFKGDVTLVKGGISLTAELKCRQNEFASIYAAYRHEEGGRIYTHDGKSVIISYYFNDLGYAGGCKPIQGNIEINRTLNKIFGLHKFVKTCDFLVIKIDRKPFLFLRFL